MLVGLLFALAVGGGVIAGLESVADTVSTEISIELGAGGGAAVIIAVWILILISSPRWYCVGLTWSGETYPAAGQTEGATAVCQAAKVPAFQAASQSGSSWT